MQLITAVFASTLEGAADCIQNPVGTDSNGAKRLVILSAYNNVQLIAHQKAGRHGLFVSPSQWPYKLATTLGADPFLLFVHCSSGLLDTIHLGSYTVRYEQDNAGRHATSTILSEVC